MKIYLSELNKKIDILVVSSQDAETEIKSYTDRKNITVLMKLDAEGKSIERPSISVYFNAQIQTKTKKQEEVFQSQSDQHAEEGGKNEQKKRDEKLPAP